MSEYRSPHNDGHDPYILVWEYGNDIQRAAFTDDHLVPTLRVHDRAETEGYR